LVDNSVTAPISISTDPYTGENTTHGGYTVEGAKIEIAINNQAFTSYFDASANRTLDLFYCVRYKGHFETTWVTIDWTGDHTSGPIYHNSYAEANYQSQYTVLIFPRPVPSNGLMDFQVQACIGYVEQVGVSSYSAMVNMYETKAAFTGDVSEWSSTQTITLTLPEASIFPSASPTPTLSPIPLPSATQATPIPSPAISASPNPTPSLSPSPTVPEMTSAIAILTVIVATGVAVVTFKMKNIRFA
jgi:hypothetical protein